MSIDEFLAAYSSSFAQGELDRVGQQFHYPVHVVGSSAGAGAHVLSADEMHWRQVLDHVLGGYRRLGVEAAEVIEQTGFHLGDGVDLVHVRWRLRRPDMSTVYEFDATYTIVTLGGHPLIAAVAHNETDRLRAALSGLGSE